MEGRLTPRSGPAASPVTLGIELEAYSIELPGHFIGRGLAFPRRGLGEHGEKFRRDATIGTEYNSRPFATIREGLFLLKAGLRKYNRSLYRSKSRSRKGKRLLLAGGWRDRYAGAHIHVSLSDRQLDLPAAGRLATHLHDHIPLLIAMGANSPIWADVLTGTASNRILHASDTYFRPVRRGGLTSRAFDEMTFNRSRKTKPATLELRVLDSNLPEFILAACAAVKAVALAWRARESMGNRIRHTDYLRARKEAAALGMRSRICWNGHWIPAREYLNRFVWTYRDVFRRMDLPQEVWTTLKLLKTGWNGGRILAEGARRAYREHPQTWQRRFAKRYVRALDVLLSGHTLPDYAHALGVDLPSLGNVHLGRKGLRLA